MKSLFAMIVCFWHTLHPRASRTFTTL